MRFLFLLFALGSSAAPPPKRPPALTPATLVERVLITADKGEAFLQRKQAVFSGRAKATRGKAIITCDRITATYSDSRDITRVEAEGNVEVVEGDRWAKGDRADFDNLTGVLVVTGNPQARQGSNHVAGSLVTFTVGTDVIEVADARTLIEETAGPRAKEPKTVIDADLLRIQSSEHLAIWTGKVKCRRGDVFIKTDRLVAFYGEDNEVQRLDATGGVEVTEADRWARGEKADYDVKKGRLVVTGNPQARQGPTSIRGSRLVFHVGRELIEVDNPVTQTVLPAKKGRP